MTAIYKLDNKVKHYAWGSPEWIPRLLGKENPKGEPWAELWMGTHSGGPSMVTTGEGKTIPLGEIAEIPFLFKFLAAGSPLSIQAHPNRDQAREGFKRENKAGIPLSAPERNYRDPNHKPEILRALSPFRAMAGFREREETRRLLSLVEGTKNLLRALEGGYGQLLSALFSLDGEERNTLTGEILDLADQARRAGTGGTYGAYAPDEAKALGLCGEFARHYPGDPGILSPLYLNLLDLTPGEAIFIPAGILHAYVEGFAMECMANSDNVLRGGLTSKRVDPEELLSILRLDPFKPEVLNPLELAPGCYLYPAPREEFALYLLDGGAEAVGDIPRGVELEAPEPGIITVSEGAVECRVWKDGDGPRLKLNPGEAAYVGRREPGERLILSGQTSKRFTAFAALGPDAPGDRSQDT